MGYAPGVVKSVSAEDAEQFTKISIWKQPFEKSEIPINNERERVLWKRSPSPVRGHNTGVHTMIPPLRQHISLEG